MSAMPDAVRGLRQQIVPLGQQNGAGVAPQRASGAQVQGAGNRPRLFSGILPEEYNRVISAGRTKEFARGETLYIEGEPVQQVLLLASGFVKVNKLGMSGAEVILHLCGPGDVLGALGLFSTGRHCSTAQAFRRCRALVWDAATLKSMVVRCPILHQNLVAILGEYLLQLEQRFHEVATERVGPRVARQLVRLQEKLGRPVNGAMEMALSREELAQMTGTTLFTVSRLLSTWESRGFVKAGREVVTVCDVASLNAVSE